MARSSLVDVQIANRVLRVGSKVYPLHAIAEVEPIMLKPSTGGYVGRFCKQVGLCAAIGVGGSILVSCAGAPSGGYAVVAGLAFVVFVWSVVRLVYGLTRPTFYALRVFTMMGAQNVIVSSDGRVIEQLVSQIIQAMANPAVSYFTRIESVNVGNTYGGDQQIGNRTVNNY